jgi:hypothetical protein
MPFGNVGAYACQNLQTDLVNYFGRNAAQYRTYGDVSAIKWLISPQNTNGFERIDIRTIPGKIRPVAFRVVDPYCFDVAQAERLCTETAGNITQSPQEIVYDFTGDPYRVVDGNGDPVRLKIDMLAMQQYCTVDDMRWVTDQIARFLMRFEEVLDKRFLELLVAAAGTNKAGDAITNLPLWIANTINNTSVLNPETEFALSQTMRDIMVDTQWGAIGGSLLNKVKQFKGWAGLDAAGVDMSKVDASNPWIFYDRNAESILGTTDFLQVAPGTAQLISWNMYAPGSSIRRQVSDLYSSGTITLPKTGLDIDWDWRYDYECKVWYFEPSLYSDIITVPPGGCSTPGVNGIIRVHDCSGLPVIPVCPEVPVG